jgi:hypothetical protein
MTFREIVCARCHKPLRELVAQFRCLECRKIFCKKHFDEHSCPVPAQRKEATQ